MAVKRNVWWIGAFIGVMGIAFIMRIVPISPTKSEEPQAIDTGNSGVAVEELETAPENPEAAPEKLEKSTTSEGFLKSAIPLFSNENDRLIRNGDRIEVWVFENGQWLLDWWSTAEDQIKIRVYPTIAFDEHTERFTYTYTLTVDPTSKQGLSTFGFSLQTREGFDSPFPYEFTEVTEGPDFPFKNLPQSDIWFWRNWTFAPLGSTQVTFSFRTSHPPGVICCFSTGLSNNQMWARDEDSGTVRPSWWDLGVGGRTIGPVPGELDCELLAQRIISYLDVSIVEEWISESAAAYLRQQLTSYLQSVPNGNFEDARARIDQSLGYIRNRSSGLSAEGKMLFEQNLLLLRRLT